MERLTDRVNRIDLSSSQSTSYIEVNRTRLTKLEGLVQIVQDDIETMRVELGETNKRKLDERLFYDNRKVVMDSFHDVRNDIDSCINESKSVENFIEKYLPVKVQN